MQQYKFISLQKIEEVENPRHPMNIAVGTVYHGVIENGHFPIAGQLYEFSLIENPENPKFIGRYFHTSTVQEILEQKDDYVKFRTHNSIYELKIIGIYEPPTSQG